MLPFLFLFLLFPFFLVYHLARCYGGCAPFLYLMGTSGSVETEYHDTYAYTHTHTSGEAGYSLGLSYYIFILRFFLLPFDGYLLGNGPITS